MAQKDKQTYFEMKRFRLSNSRSPMKVGTDGVLLGAWCALPDNASPGILDVGCGTGIIALMLAQRAPQSSIYAIDINADAAEEASENARHSPFANRIIVNCVDFNSFATPARFDLIVCNPPFFNETLQSPDEARAHARHEGSLTIENLLRRSAGMISDNGSVALIAPAARDADISFAASLAGLNIWRKTHVVTVEGKQPRRTLWQFTHTALPPISDTLYIHASDGSLTSQYRQLLHEFYINL